MQQCGADRRGAKAYLLRGYLGHGYGMEYVGLAGAAPHTLVSKLGKIERALDYLYLLAVVTLEITVEKVAELALYQGVLRVRGKCVILQVHGVAL